MGDRGSSEPHTRAGPGAADAAGDPSTQAGSPVRRKRSGGVSVIAGGLLQDLEDRMRRDLAPIEERVRPGEETRGLVGGVDGPTGSATDPLVVVLPDRA